MIISKRDTTARHMAPPVDGVDGVDGDLLFCDGDGWRQFDKFRGLKGLQRVSTVSTVSASKVSRPNAAMYVRLPTIARLP